MYLEHVESMSLLARRKVAFLERSRLSYTVAAILAGAYVGLGIILIFSIGAPLAAAGSVLLAYIVTASGALTHAVGFIENVASAKMNMSVTQMLLRGLLCNWLVCLALWTSAQAKSDVAKCIFFGACSLSLPRVSNTALPT